MKDFICKGSRIRLQNPHGTPMLASSPYVEEDLCTAQLCFRGAGMDLTPTKGQVPRVVPVSTEGIGLPYCAGIEVLMMADSMCNPLITELQDKIVSATRALKIGKVDR